MTFLDEESKNAFLIEYDRQQQFNLDKLEIIYGKEYADEMRKNYQISILKVLLTF